MLLLSFLFSYLSRNNFTHFFFFFYSLLRATLIFERLRIFVVLRIWNCFFFFFFCGASKESILITYVSATCSTTKSTTSSFRSVIWTTSSKLRSTRDTPFHSNTWGEVRANFYIRRIRDNRLPRTRSTKFLRLFDEALPILRTTPDSDVSIYR